MNNKSVPDLALLEALTVLVSECSVTRAAARLGLSQPATSHVLARLRLLLGDPLLVRSGHRLVPTERALALLPEAVELVNRARQLVASPRAFAPSTSDACFRVNASAFAGSLLAARTMKACATLAPAARLEFRIRTPDVSLGELEQGGVDFQLGWWAEPPNHLRHRALLSEELVVLAARGHAFAHRPDADNFFSARHARVDGDGSSHSNRVIDEAAVARNVQVRVGFVAPHAYAMAEAVSCCDLIGVASRRLSQDLAERYELELHRLPFEVAPFRVSLYWHQRTDQWPSHKWFRTVLARSARFKNPERSII